MEKREASTRGEAGRGRPAVRTLRSPASGLSSLLLLLCVLCASVVLLAAAPCCGPAGEPPLLLVFGASWCGPCRQMAPDVERLEESGLVRVQHVDIDADTETARRWRVEVVPTCVLVVGGSEAGRLVGATSYAELAQLCRRGVTGPAPVEIQNPAPPGGMSPGITRPANWPVCVLVVARYEGGAIGGGSGTIAAVRHGTAYVVTCGHGLREPVASLEVVTPDGRRFPARQIGGDDQVDVAVLAIDAPGLEAVELADAMPEMGQKVWAGGYGPDGTWAWYAGEVTAHAWPGLGAPDGPPPWIEWTGDARDGDSGGGVFLATTPEKRDCVLVGLISASRDGRSVGPAMPAVRDLLAQWIPDFPRPVADLPVPPIPVPVPSLQPPASSLPPPSPSTPEPEAAAPVTPPAPTPGAGGEGSLESITVPDSPGESSTPPEHRGGSSAAAQPRTALPGASLFSRGPSSLLDTAGLHVAVAIASALGITLTPAAGYVAWRVVRGLIAWRRRRRGRRPQTGDWREEEGRTTEDTEDAGCVVPDIPSPPPCPPAEPKTASQTQPATEQTPPPPLGVGWQDGQTTTRNRYVRVRETNLEGEAYKEAIASWATSNPRTAGLMQAVDELAQNIYHGKQVAARMEPQPDDPQIVPQGV